jgi:hypothetical protein
MHTRAGEKMQKSGYHEGRTGKFHEERNKETQRDCGKEKCRTRLVNKRFARPSFRVRRGLGFLRLV